MHYQLLWELGLRPAAFRRIVIAVGYLVPIPAFFFFRTLNLLGQTGRIVSTFVWPVVLCLSLVTLVIGPREIFGVINNSVVTTALVVVVIALVRTRSGDPDITLIRRGLLFFIACALFDNLTGIFARSYNIEPFSFIVLLACLGIVAGRRSVTNEKQLIVIRKELEIAKQIQLSILPPSFPTMKSFRVAARYLPMTSVAADSPSELLLGMNTILYGNTQSQFVTAGYVYLNASSRELRYSAAAHPPMLLLRGGQVTEITENGLMLAAFNFATYTTVTQPLQPNDRLVLYTDGLLEATNSDREEFGSTRLHALVRETANLANAEAGNQIISSIQRWSADQNDDLTILLCDYTA